tara:strand:- start:544 stop:927 length:384 start_codon:yes stop_codon:yes gene_type:complete
MNKENIMETMDVDKTNEKQSNDKSSIEDELDVALVERNILLEMMKKREDLMVGKTDNKVKKKTIRCSFCNKKCNMINITCKCGGVFCQLHMSLSSHKCPKLINKKEEVKDTIASQNPKMNTSKMEKI